MTVPFIDVGLDPVLKSEITTSVNGLFDRSAFVGGEPVAQFDRAFGEYCGGGHCVSVANGTDALILALRAFDLKPTDEVITVPFTFIASAASIGAMGAQVKFVDIDPKNYTMDIHELERAITPKTKAIIPVHLFGQPADMDPIMTLARKHGLKVIEDACQAHGAEYKLKRVGTLGDISCFSFYPTKNLGGAGDGGAVVSSSKELIAKVTQLANHGRSGQYFHEIEGVNSRLDAIQAVVLSAKLKRLDAWNERRRQIALVYQGALRENTFATPPHVESYSKHVFHLYCIESSHRDGLLAHLKAKGIGCGVYYPLPLHLMPAFARLKQGKGSFPVSERLSERILSLPMFPTMTDSHVQEVCEALKSFSPRTLA